MTTLSWTDLDSRAVDTARLLAADAVQKAGSGHPGTAMSLAPVAYYLYHHALTLDPADPSSRRPVVGRTRPLRPLPGAPLAPPVRPAPPRRVRPRTR